MTKRCTLAVALIITLSGALFAGDVATFVNMGFSRDARILMFGQYGIEAATARPYAEIYVVDVVQNRFVADGVRRKTFDARVTPGQDGSGALLSLLADNAGLVARHNIDPLNQGRLVYFLVNGQTPRAEITFRDFTDGSRYTVRLRQNSRGHGSNVEAAFHLELTAAAADGARREFIVGLPDFYRRGVTSYQIHQAFVSPDERSLVFVVERITDTPTGRSLRYMVETVRVR